MTGELKLITPKRICCIPGAPINDEIEHLAGVPDLGLRGSLLIKMPDLPEDHPEKDAIMSWRGGTDPGLATRTRRGTGLYKVPSLKGVWYRYCSIVGREIIRILLF